MLSKKLTPPGIERQRQYVTRQIEAGDDGSLIVGAAFVNGIRDLGYRSTATALDELIDNSMQAAASKIHVVFGFEGNPSEKKPTAIAVIDDGFGMIPEMLAFAAKWGGTDREGDRKGFGRYGYGLPSSCVSQGERFRLYSRPDGAEMYEVCVDLEKIRLGHGTEGTRVLAPVPAAADMPKWVQAYIIEHFDGLPHGTIVLIDKLDRLTWSTRSTLKPQLLQHTGLVYRKYLRDTTLVIDGTKVESIDPLFLTENARYYDLDADRAEGIDQFRIEAKDDDGKVQGWINIRISYLPPTFGYKDKTLVTKVINDRMKVMEDHEGLIVMRNSRQIDVLPKAYWRKGRSFRSEDRYWQVEIDFSAELDELFSVTTSKQSVKLRERVWELLQKYGVDTKVDELAKRRNVEFEAYRKRPVTEDTKRPSEIAMEESAKFVATKPRPEDAERLAKSKENVVADAATKAQEVGVPVDVVLDQLFKDIDNRKYALVTRDVPEGPFYRPELYGGQKRLVFNTDHPFYTEVYASPRATPEVRNALEVLLFVLAEAELDARGEREQFYKAERQAWSQRLKDALQTLASVAPDAPPPEPQESPAVETSAEAIA